MKRIIAFLMLIAIALCIAACGEKIKLDESSRVSLTFQVDKIRIRRTLTSDESKIVHEVLNGSQALDLPTESESCSFSERVSLTIDDVVFAMAQDECYMLKNLQTNEIIILSQEKYGKLIALFEKYGGYFPVFATPEATTEPAATSEAP